MKDNTMTIEAANEFRQAVKDNVELEGKIRTLFNEEGLLDLSATASLGLKHGYIFNEGDVEAIFANDNDDLSDFELEMVSAGVPIRCANVEIKA